MLPFNTHLANLSAEQFIERILVAGLGVTHVVVGYDFFFGKDRRGQLHQVPLMSVSIGVVTNERRHFSHPSQVSELATEMKSYAKSMPGSVFAVDRRTDGPCLEASGIPLDAVQPVGGLA